MFMGGGMVGNAAMTAVLHLFPNAWQNVRYWLCVCHVFNVLPAVTYLHLGRMFFDGRPAQRKESHVTNIEVYLCLGNRLCVANHFEGSPCLK